MAAEFVTIGITCFNAEDTIERAIASAANRTRGSGRGTSAKPSRLWPVVICFR